MIKKDFKQKYFLFCHETKLEIKKYSDLLVQEEKPSYIRIIKIKEIINGK